MRWLALAFLAAVASWSVPVVAQTGSGNAPPPMVFAVPRVQLGAADGDVLAGVDLGFAVPLSTKSSVTGSLLLDLDGDDALTATYNWEMPLKGRTHARASAGLFQDEVGFGLSAHRVKDDYGVGAYARSVEGDLETGVFLSTKLAWGMPVGKPRGGHSSSWGDTSGDVGDMGAIATVGVNPREGADHGLVTGTAWYPRYTSNWRRMGQDAQSAGATVSEFGAPATAAWTFEARGAMVGGPVIVADRVYAAGETGVVHCLRLADGSPLWTAALGSPVTRALTADGGRIYAGTRAGHLVCLRPPMLPEGMVGVEEWRFDAGAPISSCPVVTRQGMVVFGTESGDCCAVDARGKLAWRFSTRGPIVAAVSLSATPQLVPAGSGATRRAMPVIYCASTDGVLYALREADGQTLWTFATGSPVRAAPTVYNDKVLVGNDEGTLYCLAAGSGRQIWRQSPVGPLHAAPTVADGRVYVAGVDGTVAALSVGDGERLWRASVFGDVTAQPIVTRSRHLFVATEAGMLYALRIGDGRTMWAKNMQEALCSGPAVAGKYLLLGGEGGQVYALAPGGKWQIDAPPAALRMAHRRTGRLGGVEVVKPETGPSPDAAAAAPATRSDAVTVKAPPGQEDFPRPEAGTTAVEPGVTAGMSLLTRAGDPSQPPIQIADSSSVVISGRVPPHTQSVTVNDVPVPITSGSFRTRLDFFGTGAFPLTIRFVDTAGKTTLDRRIVVVSSETHPGSTAPVFLTPEAEPSGKIAFTLSADQAEWEPAVSVLEIRNASGQVVRAWASVGERTQTYEWNGRDQLGKPLPQGEYVAVYTTKDTTGRSRSVCQPVVIETAGM